MMDPTAMLWAKCQMERQERADLCCLIAEANASQAKLRPILAERRAAVQARMRQDGATGFVMVPQ